MKQTPPTPSLEVKHNQHKRWNWLETQQLFCQLSGAFVKFASTLLCAYRHTKRNCTWIIFYWRYLTLLFLSKDITSVHMGAHVSFPTILIYFTFFCWCLQLGVWKSTRWTTPALHVEDKELILCAQTGKTLWHLVSGL